jgi:hypothetical protein
VLFSRLKNKPLNIQYLARGYRLVPHRFSNLIKLILRLKNRVKKRLIWRFACRYIKLVWYVWLSRLWGEVTPTYPLNSMVLIDWAHLSPQANATHLLALQNPFLFLLKSMNIDVKPHFWHPFCTEKKRRLQFTERFLAKKLRSKIFNM